VYDEGRLSVVTVLLVEVRAFVVAAWVVEGLARVRSSCACFTQTLCADPYSAHNSHARCSVGHVQTRNGEVSVEPLGSGVIWDQRGNVVVNYHCIARTLAAAEAAAAAAAAGSAAQAGAAPTSAATSAQAASGTASGSAGAGALTRVLRVSALDATDGTVKDYAASVVGMSPVHDLAVLLLADAPQEFLAPVPLGSNADVRVGQSAFAVAQQSLSYGIVSGLRRPLPSPTGQLVPGGAVQTDAAVDGGNSGGALLDSSGRLMGICTATALPPRASGLPPRAASLSFAIPVDTVRSVVPQLIAFGRVVD
jgi:S1-C subfamily serine protease